MKLHRFIGDFDFTDEELTVTNREIAHQIKDVLRIEKEERLVLVDSHGQEVLVEIQDFIDGLPLVRVIERLESSNQIACRVSLYCAILKRENFELAVQKATELGVTEIIPVITERTIKLGLKMDRLRKIAKEASEQSGRSLVPIIFEPQTYKSALVDSQRHEATIILDPEGASRIKALPVSSVGVFVGPEGGWTEAELIMAIEMGFNVMNLGTLILRGETAAMIAVDRLVCG